MTAGWHSRTMTAAAHASPRRGLVTRCPERLLAKADSMIRKVSRASSGPTGAGSPSSMLARTLR